MRMGFESLVVAAHAMGRTLVISPNEALYLISAKHKDELDKEEHSEMGISDFYNIRTLKSQKGFHAITMSAFLQREGITGKLHGILPPKNSARIWGRELWDYLSQVADVNSKWFDKFLAFPDHPGDFQLRTLNDTAFKDRLKRFSYQYENNMVREPVYYDEVNNAS